MITHEKDDIDSNRPSCGNKSLVFMIGKETLKPQKYGKQTMHLFQA